MDILYIFVNDNKVFDMDKIRNSIGIGRSYINFFYLY